MQAGKKKLVLDHLIVQKMDDDENGSDDLRSILTFGARALFEEEDQGSKDIICEWYLDSSCRSQLSYNVQTPTMILISSLREQRLKGTKGTLPASPVSSSALLRYGQQRRTSWKTLETLCPTLTMEIHGPRH